MDSSVLCERRNLVSAHVTSYLNGLVRFAWKAKSGFCTCAVTFKWTGPFRAEDEIWFLRMCRHISNSVYSLNLQVLIALRVLTCLCLYLCVNRMLVRVCVCARARVSWCEMAVPQLCSALLMTSYYKFIPNTVLEKNVKRRNGQIE